MVNLKVDKASLNNAKLALGVIGKSVDPIIYRAINKTIGNTQTRAVDKISGVLNLTKTRIRKDFTQKKAFAKKLSGQLLASGKPIGFMEFKPTALKKGKGISIKFKKQGSREIFRHQFIAIGKGGKYQVFEREDYGDRPWVPNYPYAKMPHFHKFPLDRLAAAALEDYYGDDRIYVPVQLYASMRLEHHTLDQIDYELKKNFG